MKTTILSKVLIVLLCSVSFVTTHAQGLSLSFNLSETDTLANMIAESKKYDITELTLSGVINIPNANYIRDLNQNGKLKSLNMGNVIGLHGAVIKRAYGWINHNNPQNETLDQYDDNHIIGQTIISYRSHTTDYNWHCSVNITDSLHDDYFIRSYRFDFLGGWDYSYYNKNIKYEYSEKWPKDVFRDCYFDKFVMPHNLTVIGGADCSFCPQKAEVIVIGDNIQKIDNFAFKGAYLGKIEVSQNTRIIGKSAFENTNGGFLSNSFFTNLTSIAYSAFKDSKLVPSTLSLSSIQELGGNSFINTTIEDVEIGNNLTSICDSTFANCINLEKFIGFTNIKSIGDWAFYGCKNLKIIGLSTKLTSIGKEAFANTALVNFSVPNTTKTIGYKAFANSGLKELDLGIFESYHRDIIDGCDSLEIISVSDNNDYLKTKNGVLFSKNGNRIISYPCAKKDAIYELGNIVTEISDSAFYDVKKLGILVIPESVEKIGKNAFANSGICEIKLLPSTTPKVTDNKSGLDQSLVRLFVHDKDYSSYYIANYWGDFKNIFILEKAVSTDNIINVEKAGTLPEYIGFGNQFMYKTLCISGYLNSDDVRYLREMAGRDIRGNKTAGLLSDLDFSQASIVKGGNYYYIKNNYSSGKLNTSDNVIGESMFEGCNFKSLAISETVTKIDNKALYGCPLTVFRIPAATKELNPNSFFGMNTLKEFIVDENNNNYQAQNGVLFTKDGKTLLLYPYAKEGEQYYTPKTITCIGEQAFGGSNLKIVITNEGLSEIETMAFDNLASLEGISLPSTLKQIGNRAFWRCNKLLDISCEAYNPPTLIYDPYEYYDQPYNNFSEKTYKNAVLMVPEKNGGYKNRAGWKLFNNIIESDSWMSGMQTINNNANDNVIKRYDINGRVINNPTNGINIIKKNDGTTKKVVVR